MNTTCEAVDDGSNFRKRMLQKDKYDFLEYFKYLVNVLNKEPNDVINKEIDLNMIIEEVDISERFTKQNYPDTLVISHQQQ